MENPIILVVTDNDMDGYTFKKTLRIPGFNVIPVENNEIDLHLAGLHQPDVIVLDTLRPGGSTKEVFNKLELKTLFKDVPVLVIVPQHSDSIIIDALDAGASDCLCKPFSIEELGARLHSLSRMKIAEDQLRNQNSILEQKVQKRTAEINKTLLEVIRRLGLAAEYRDNETGDHAIRMSKMCMKLGELYGLNKDRQELLLNASPMHDIGNISIPDAVMFKPGKLTAEEWQIMTEHTIVGARILDGHDSHIMHTARDIALTHHEKWNGKGYPHGLKGEEISLDGRIAAIADVFDSLTSKRPYKDAYPIDFALRIIESERGEHFDPNLTDLFLDNRSVFEAIKRKNSDRIVMSGDFELSDRDKKNNWAYDSVL